MSTPSASQALGFRAAGFMQRAESVGNPQGPLKPPIVLQPPGRWRTGQQQGLRGLLSSGPWRGGTWAVMRARKGPAGRRDWREQLLAAGRPWAASWQQRLGIQNTLVRSWIPVYGA